MYIHSSSRQSVYNSPIALKQVPLSSTICHRLTQYRMFIYTNIYHNSSCKIASPYPSIYDLRFYVFLEQYAIMPIMLSSDNMQSCDPKNQIDPSRVLYSQIGPVNISWYIGFLIRSYITVRLHVLLIYSKGVITQ